MATYNTPTFQDHIPYYNGGVQRGIKEVNPVVCLGAMKISLQGTNQYLEYQVGGHTIEILSDSRDGKYIGATDQLGNNKFTASVGVQFFTKKIFLPLELKQAPIANMLSITGQEQGKKFMYHKEDYSIAAILTSLYTDYTADENALGFENPLSVSISVTGRSTKTETYANTLYDALVSLNEALRKREYGTGMLRVVLRDEDYNALVRSKYVNNRDLTSMPSDTVTLVAPEVAGLNIVKSPRFPTYNTAYDGSGFTGDTSLDLTATQSKVLGMVYEPSQLLHLESIPLMAHAEPDDKADMLAYVTLTTAYSMALRRKDNSGLIVAV